MNLKTLPDNWKRFDKPQATRQGETVTGGKAIRARRGRMNKTETLFADTVLSQRLRTGEIKSWLFEPMKFKIGVSAWYCPDFVVTLNDGRQEVYEIKGHRYAAGIVRVKAAAMIWPTIRFVLVMRGKGASGWSYTDVG